MIIRMRPYGGDADKSRMAALVRAFPDDNLHAADLPYRLSSWAFDDPGRVGLWEDGAGRLLAWAVLQGPFWTIDYAYHPEGRDYGIHPQILTWATMRAAALAGTPAGRPAWFVAVRPDQTGRRGDLERHGFAEQTAAPANPWSQVYMVRPATLPVAPAPLPAGFTMRPLAGGAEVDRYVDVHRAAFGSANMTAAWRARTLDTPEYISDLDLVVTASDGRLAAFCIGWLTPPGTACPRVGQIEPMGVHPDFQQQGLGRAVLGECLRRLVAHGAQTLVVEPDNDRDAAYALYESAGFTAASRILMYRWTPPIAEPYLVQ